MKKVFAVILTVVTLLSCLLAAAQSDDGEIFKRDRRRIRWGIAMTAEMAGRAADHAESAGNDRQLAVLTRFSQVDFPSPDKAIVLEFDKTGMEQARAALGFQGVWSGSSIALAEIVNAQSGADYSQAALLAQAEGETTQEYSKTLS